MRCDEEEQQLRAAALQNVQSILQARQRAEQELIGIKEALEEERRILELLNQTGAVLASKLDLQAVVQTVTDAGTKMSGAQFGAFFYNVSTESGNVFTLFTLSGAPREAFEKLGHPRATPVFAPTFKGEGTIRSGDITKDPRYGKMEPHRGMPAGHLPVRSYLAVPVIARSGEVMGGLFFGHPNTDVFSVRAERLIEGIASQAAIAIDNARLYEQARQAAEERARLLVAERRARQESERVSLMKDEFLATLSHELRTPLNAVLGWSNILLSKTPGDSDGYRGLSAIARNARAQAKLIDDLLDMNSIVSGKIRLDVHLLDLPLILDAAIDAVRPSADAKSIVIRAILDPNAGPVFGDRNRIQQVVWNLLSNSVKFTPKNGKIDVVLRRVNSHVEICVHDTGVGISTDFLPHVFERFRQADSSTTRKHGGLGLGLSIVKQLIELHGGTVRVESAGEGQGTTFVLLLPLRPILSRASAPSENVNGPSNKLPEPYVSLDGIMVLVVDDEPDARDLVAAVLSQAKATVITASSAEEALALVKSCRPAVIVSDIGMPERDGYDFMRDVRSLPGADGGRTPAIALTAFARSEDRTRAMLSGYQVHVAKPIEPDELVATVKSQCGAGM
jgi:signal transduction histidine kinase/CheY-like chemotaxis protein